MISYKQHLLNLNLSSSLLAYSWQQRRHCPTETYLIWWDGVVEAGGRFTDGPNKKAACRGPASGWLFFLIFYQEVIYIINS